MDRLVATVLGAVLIVGVNLYFLARPRSRRAVKSAPGAADDPAGPR